MKTIKAYETPALPDDLSSCPICQQKLTIVSFDCWAEDNKGHWYATEVHTRCASEPAIDSEGWDEWFNGHYATPYIDWLPVQNKIVAWLKANYRFQLT